MNEPVDTYRDAFLAFLKCGMSYVEARDQFDKELLQAAVNAELERGDSVQVLNPETFLCENACGHETLFDLVVKAGFEQRNSVGSRDMDQAMDLWQAGWTSEDTMAHLIKPNEFWSQTQVMSWYWRAPSKRPGKPGRRYLSTNQAWNAMQRERGPK